MSDKPYKVGHGKPPRSFQFKPGQSGNPNGRPKGSKNIATDLAEEFSERIEIREGGNTRRISKQRALIKALFSRALKGSDSAAFRLFDLYAKAHGLEEAADEADLPLTKDEQEVLRSLEQRVLQKLRVGEEEDQANV